nr:unnamed protein product [Callosobruchus analis]CAI5820008.1 unnamed protein product [Callosobruchus analis]
MQQVATSMHYTVNVGVAFKRDCNRVFRGVSRRESSRSSQDVSRNASTTYDHRGRGQHYGGCRGNYNSSTYNRGRGRLGFYNGCTDHMVTEKDYFIDLCMLENPLKIAVAKDGDFLLVMGVGNIQVYSYVGSKSIKCTIQNVFYVPDLRKNLVLVK